MSNLQNSADFEDGISENKETKIIEFNKFLSESAYFVKNEEPISIKIVFWNDIHQTSYPFSKENNNYGFISERFEKQLMKYTVANKIFHFNTKFNLFLLNDGIFVKSCIDEYKFVIKTLIEICLSSLLKYFEKSTLLQKDEFIERINKSIFLFNNDPNKFVGEGKGLSRLTHEIYNENRQLKKPNARKNKKDKDSLYSQIQNLRNNNKFTVKRVCREMHISKGKYYTIVNWAANRNEESCEISERSPLRTKLKGIELEFIRKLLNDPFTCITATEIKKQLFINFGINFSVSAIRYHILHTFKFSYKRTKFRDSSCLKPVQNVLEYKALRTLVNLLKQGKSIVFFDEIGFEDLTNGYSYGPIGMPSVKYKAHSVGKLNMIMCVDYNKIIAYKITKSNFNTRLFLSFVQSVASKEIDSDEKNAVNKVYLFDGAKYHFNKCCLKMFRLLPMDIMINSPYSPQYNMIETVFSEIKRQVKSSLPASLHIFFLTFS